MREFFDSKNPLAVFLMRLGRLCVSNVLMVICSIPIITAGAAICATHKVAMDMAYDEDEHVFKTFFTAFRKNFKPATILWVIVALAATLLYFDFIFVHAFFEAKTFMYVMLSIPTIIVLSISVYLFPLVARYRNTLRNYIHNAGVFAIIKMHKTIAMIALHAIPVLIFFFSPPTFVYTAPIWCLFGFSFIFYIDAVMLRPVFEEIEKEKGVSWDI